MTNDQQIDLIEKFYTFIQVNTIDYKPSNVGMKCVDCDKNKGRVHLPEPELFSIKYSHHTQKRNPGKNSVISLVQSIPMNRLSMKKVLITSILMGKYIECMKSR